MTSGFIVDESVREVLSRPPMAVTPVVREYRCTECHSELEVNNKAPESYAPDWQVKPCQACLDKLEEATKDELNEDWTKDYDKLKDDHSAEMERVEKRWLERVDELKDQLAEARAEWKAETNKLENELQATKLLLKDAQQAHLFAKFRADRLSREE